MRPGIHARWEKAVLVCAKCSKKLDGGFGKDGRRPLARALRKHLDLKNGPKARAGIVETKCLGVCPKGAVTVVDSARPDEWLLITAGADLDGVARSLGLAESAGQPVSGPPD